MMDYFFPILGSTLDGNSLTMNQAYNTICPSCSAIIFETTSDPAWTLFSSVNKYNVQLGFISNQTYDKVPVSMCSDVISIPNAMKQFETPPVPLVQSYYDCKKSISDSFFYSFGISYGNAMLVTTIIMVIVGKSFLYYLNLKHSKVVHGSPTPLPHIIPVAMKEKIKYMTSKKKEELLFKLLDGIIDSLANDNSNRSLRVDGLKEELDVIKRHVIVDSIE
jgi:hypothetical protein